MSVKTAKRLRARDLPTTFEELVRLHPPRAIHDDADHANTQEVIDALTDLLAPNKDQADYLETLTLLFEAYEREHEAIDLSDVGPLEVLRHLMEAHDMNTAALGHLLGDRGLGTRILNGERKLSKTHIRKLAKHFAVSPELFFD